MRAFPRDSERGAILIQTALVMLAVSGLLVFVVDYGILWVSRSQAQNAADAGALAGAVALALDDPLSFVRGGPADSSARAFARANLVFGEEPAVDVLFSRSTNPPIDACLLVTSFPPPFPPPCAGRNCIRVCVYRDPSHKNALPVWAGSILGVKEQGVSATAVAWARRANASRCLRPWAIADRWDSWTPTSSNNFDPDADTYVRPGFTVATDLGTYLTLEPNDVGTITADSFLPLDVTPDEGADIADYERTIEECTDVLWRVGESVPVLRPGALDGDITGTARATEAIIGQRIVVPVFDPTENLDDGSVTIINMIALYIEDVDDNDRIIARITTASDLVAPELDPTETGDDDESDDEHIAAFVNVVQLAR